MDTDGYTLTETTAIHEYLAAKYMPELLGSTYQERAKVAMLVGKIQDAKWAITKPCYTGDKTGDELKSLIKEQLADIARYLDVEGGLLLGYNVSYMDFYLFELILLVEFLTEEEVFQWYPCFEAYKGQMVELPRLESYLMSSSKAVTEFPFNMRFAKVNNWKKDDSPEADGMGFEEQPAQEPAKDAGANPFEDDDGSLKNPFG